MKLCTIVGARPQFIKAAAVSRVIAQRQDMQEIIIHTGQHYDANMSEQFFDELSIPKPGYHLNIGSNSHGKQTGQMLAAIEDVLQHEKPKWVLVYGDTNSTLAGALAAVKLHIPVAHVEAGLRSFNRKMPEEINRITADHLSSILFAPTDNGVQQLLREGIAAEQIFNVGDVMYDATLYYNEYNSQRRTMVEKLHLTPKSYCLVTIHRAENTDCPERLRNICKALLELSTLIKVILPLHPRTRNALDKLQLLKSLQDNLTLIDPVGYLDMLALEKDAYWIVTDSGGVQKEAYFNRVPCITLRDETEWVELVDAGWNRLCSPDKPFSLLELLKTSTNASLPLDKLYGNGDAAEQIVKILC
ncbi:MULTISPECIES: non-hydrolyzing UDP-N-acetylglucosamine 2-epimerase [Legionella]|uniref:UDP-N-acetylglucosamine 2-epimerase (Non-hydrolyzing) n=1 Tax=Legionella septentrionalis TaxID=2498109 RepID=A0A3S0V5R8_9GAMM|nr:MULTISPECIES: UDP-N-acetylglucosamine 2-epimerase (non-hydrolyzing) [Legionella]MCP0914342.1 UDP-N-acetylglucosamine 2-epimerase (non-hydrolyzing) [Legionella sp. 27cVA30]RUQ88997.1 UDP-N-acetylglucosamine 2-epimerase (non-hydrolyzing) [Legionella septentrionalis]RUR00304.1 UDP-N-acetylglucosamine 2-epimerase (non-hydrolyzing) [Legionella septentrionalis]RUR11839.1 UDP-N-acetylglucosamine 2-epimerase (non-hydrolyzing) [Legionella septentrionalis]RUR17526.1 UDP-N-acetylglucosamine 2-epimeras